MYHTSITLLSIVYIYAMGATDCNIQGYEKRYTSDSDCASYKDIPCTSAAGSVPWYIEGCGCGCKQECVTLGYSFVADAATCATIRYTCSTGYESWEDEECGCGCKQECVTLGNSFVADAATCATITYTCSTGYEPWEDEECGCGCAPISTSAGHSGNGNMDSNGKKYDEGNYFGFINFDMNRYAIYEFILMIFILMAFVLNVTFIGYCCVIRFKDLDYSLPRNMNRKKGLYTKTASECSDDTSLDDVFG